MPKILIVSPHFPPINAPDLHRVRLLLPFLRAHGWDAEVLGVAPGCLRQDQDPWLLEGLPPDIPIHRVETMGLGWSRLPGLGGTGLRALSALASAGDRLLRQGGFDLVYFSTTAFEVHLLGPRWKRRFGVPFVMDYQDPWVSDYYHHHPDLVPPGGRIKYAVAQALHRWMEPRVLRNCAGITSVSPAYPQELERRYPWLQGLPRLVEPFSGAASDFVRVATDGSKQHRFDPEDGGIHWAYLGAVLPAMHLALRGFFSALQAHGDPGLKARLRLHFIGTSYAPGAAPQVLPLAAEFGLAYCVDEVPGRIPYSETLRCQMDAHALLAFGTDAVGYTASKIYPCLLARKPLLAVFLRSSSVVETIGQVSGAVCVPFETTDSPAVLGGRISEAWLAGKEYTRVVPLDEIAFRPFTDEGSAAKLAAFFHACLAGQT